ncbi:MAG: DNA primase small subunit domain-containing protein [Methanotrichaceae archaeon]
MNPRTRNFIRVRFKEYYLQESLEMPPDFRSREWGFILFDNYPKIVMRRHKSFLSRIELVNYVRNMVPAHVYHSAAHYHRPGAPSMKEKGWLGADLIFDLDADHLRNAPSSYREMLDNVKKETFKLLNFLLDDFGFSEKHVSVVFSGGRGYHIHVRDPRILKLGSGERREIVDYLTGRGLDTKRFISEKEVRGDFGVEKAIVIAIPPQDTPGWSSRINSSMLSFVRYLRDLDEDVAVQDLSSRKGIGKSGALKFYRNLKGDYVLDQIRKGNLSSFKGSSKIWKTLIRDYLDDEGVQLDRDDERKLSGFDLAQDRGETDEPVTTDIKRLIRFPLSLHGGSGLRVTPLTIDGLKYFDPLSDAVVFGDDPVEIYMCAPFELEMRGESYHLEEGPAEVPLCVAVFLMARKLAELGKALD